MVHSFRITIGLMPLGKLQDICRGASYAIQCHSAGITNVNRYHEIACTIKIQPWSTGADSCLASLTGLVFLGELTRWKPSCFNHQALGVPTDGHYQQALSRQQTQPPHRPGGELEQQMQRKMSRRCPKFKSRTTKKKHRLSDRFSKYHLITLEICSTTSYSGDLPTLEIYPIIL